MDDATWIDLLDPDPAELDDIPEEVHPSALERLKAPLDESEHVRPRIDAHGGHFFGILVVPTVAAPGADVRYHEIDFIISPERMITVRKTPTGIAPLDMSTVRNTAMTSGAPPGMCLYHLVDEVAEDFLTLIDAFDDDVDELEDRVEEWSAEQIRTHIGKVRHDILRVRRVLTPTRDAARSILDNRLEIEGEDELFPRDVEIHFADAYDKLLRATDGLDLARDLLAGVRDYHQAKVANDQNEVMKRLTVIASVLLLPTLIVGLYGQNFDHIPELHWRYGYQWAWFLIISTTIAQVIYFRRKKWI